MPEGINKFNLKSVKKFISARASRQGIVVHIFSSRISIFNGDFVNRHRVYFRNGVTRPVDSVFKYLTLPSNFGTVVS